MLVVNLEGFIFLCVLGLGLIFFWWRNSLGLLKRIFRLLFYRGGVLYEVVFFEIKG